MTKKSSAVKILKWIAWNGVFAYSVYAGVVSGIKGWQNIASFIIIAMFILGIMILIGSKNEAVLKSYVENNNRVIPIWLDTSFDLIVVGVLVYHGWIAMGTMFLVCTVAIRILDSNAKEYTLKVLNS